MLVINRKWKLKPTPGCLLIRQLSHLLSSSITPILYISKVKYLRVHLDKYMTWWHHIQHINQNFETAKCAPSSILQWLHASSENQLQLYKTVICLIPLYTSLDKNSFIRSILVSCNSPPPVSISLCNPQIHPTFSRTLCHRQRFLAYFNLL